MQTRRSQASVHCVRPKDLSAPYFACPQPPSRRRTCCTMSRQGEGNQSENQSCEEDASGLEMHLNVVAPEVVLEDDAASSSSEEEKVSPYQVGDRRNI